MDKPKTLAKEVADKYDMLAGHNVGEYHYNGHVVNLDQADLTYADFLVEHGFPYLVEKQPANGDKAKVPARPTAVEPTPKTA